MFQKIINYVTKLSLMNLKEREIPSDLTNLYIKKLLYKKEPFILEDLHIILASTIAYSIPS